jgi:hypothetical protein
VCRPPVADQTIKLCTTPSPLQREALELLEAIDA